MRRYVGLAVGVLVLLLTGCGLLGVGLKFSVHLVQSDYDGVEVTESALVIAVNQVSQNELPRIDGFVRLALTGTVGYLNVDDMVVSWAEIEEDGETADFQDFYQQKFGLSLPAIGAGRRDLDFSIPLPETIRSLLQHHPDELLGRSFRVRFALTGMDNPTLDSVDISFVDYL